MTFWVLKAKPARSDLRTLVRCGEVGEWRTTRPPRAWKPTDGVFLWQASPALALRGVGTIVDVARPDADGVTRLQVRYELDAVEGPGIERLRARRVLADASFLKAGPAGTVFPLTDAQARDLVTELGRVADREALRAWADEVHAADTPSIAISIRQPYVEMIFRGTKPAEYRSTPTHKRGRVYVYAGKKPGAASDWRDIGLVAGALPTGLVVGTVDVLTCVPHPLLGYAYELSNPTRLAEPWTPTRQPQPKWFRPR